MQGIQIARASPSTSHLLFVDDNVFFCKEDVQQSKEVIDIIHLYGATTGQHMNQSILSIMFGNDVGLNLSINQVNFRNIYERRHLYISGSSRKYSRLRKPRFLLLYVIDYKGGLIQGQQSFSQRVAKKFSLCLLHMQFRHMLCCVSFF